MTRPEKFEDIAEHRQEGPTVMTWEPAYLLDHPEVEQHIVAARIAAREAGFIVDKKYGQTKLMRPKNEEERALALKSEQQSWDNGKEMYERALETKQMPEHPYIADTYTTREDLVRLREVEGLEPFVKEES